MDFVQDLTHDPIEGLTLKYRFVGLDLAPNVQLESGFSVVDRERNLLRLEKLYTDEEMIQHVMDVGPTNGTIVLIDMPKSLSIHGRWRQEEIKMHALRLHMPHAKQTDRYEERGRRMVNVLRSKGVQAYLYYHYLTRVNYQLLLPYRSRSPQGCRALQTAIGEVLGIKNMPTNLAPSSVLESIVAAYGGWSIWSGKPGEDFEIHLDKAGYTFFVAKKRPVIKRIRPKIMFRLRRRFQKRS